MKRKTERRKQQRDGEWRKNERMKQRSADRERKGGVGGRGQPVAFRRRPRVRRGRRVLTWSPAWLKTRVRGRHGFPCTVYVVQG